MAVDPVCGMEVNPDSAAATTTYRGDKYYFCAEGCKHKFENQPEQFMKAPGAGWAPLNKKQGFFKRLFSSK